MTFSPELQRFLSEYYSCSFERLSVTPCKSEASARKYYRITDASGNTNREQNSVLCIELPFIESHHDFLVIQKQLIKSGITVPDILEMSPQNGWILQSDAGLEDLSDFLAGKSREEQSEALKRGIDIILDFQKVKLQEPVSIRYFDHDKLYWEIEFLEEWISNYSRLRSIEPYFPFELKIFLSEVCSAIQAFEPKVFCHRDFHSRNIMINQNKYTIIDFQDARTGSVYYDPASLLFDPYADYSLEIRLSALDYFAELQPSYKKGEFSLQAVQRLLKAIGSYCFLITAKERGDYEAPLKNAFRLLTELVEFGRFPDSVYLFAVHYNKNLSSKSV